jgi:catalase
MANTVKNTVKTRKIAALVADGSDDAALGAMKKALTNAGAQLKIVAAHAGSIRGTSGKSIPVDFSLLTVASVLFDAVYIPGGEGNIVLLTADSKAVEFVEEAYKHCKAIAATGMGVEFLKMTRVGAALATVDMKPASVSNSEGVIVGRDAAVNKVAAEFIAVIACHRVWERELKAFPIT